MPDAFPLPAFFATLLFLFLSPDLYLSLEICPSYFCPHTGGEIGNTQQIHFPFSLAGGNESRRCSYPYFSLACNGTQQPTITLASSGNFTVESIDYVSQLIWVSDPDGCLPRRILSLDLSNVPFHGVDHRNYTFLNCKGTNSTPLFRRRAVAVPCLSGENFTVFSTAYRSTVKYMVGSVGCGVMKSVRAPDWWEFSRYKTGPDLDSAFLRLAWDEPDCADCERRGGVCRFESDSGLKVGCSISSNSTSKLVSYGLLFGLGIPIFICMIGLTFYISGRIRVNWNHQGIPDFSLSIFPHPQPSLPMVGLDGPTIESYPMTLLGESKRLPNPADGLCAICLSEYQAKETLRTIPECNHYFHAQCIDEWLQMQGTCPLCRSSPGK